MAGIDKELLELIGREDNPESPVQQKDAGAEDELHSVPPPPPSEPYPEDIGRQGHRVDSSIASPQAIQGSGEVTANRSESREGDARASSMENEGGAAGDAQDTSDKVRGGWEAGEELAGNGQGANEVGAGNDRGAGDTTDVEAGQVMEAGEIARSDVEMEEGEAVDSEEEGGIGEDDDAPVIDLREDLVYGEEDRVRLLGMTEVDREMVYAERIEKREREKTRQRLLHGDREDPGNDDEHRSGVRREKDNRNRKDSALRELQKRKAEQDQRKISSWDARDESEGGDSHRERSEGESEEARSAEISESESDNDRGRRGSHDAFGSHNELEVVEEEYADMKDFSAIQVFRSQLERWISEPHFEATVPNCFVRMAEAENHSGTVRRGYRIMEIMECVQYEHKPYRYGERGGVTAKYMRLREGHREHIRDITMVSNQPFLPREFERWRHCCERDNRTPISKQSAAATQEKISKAGKYTYSAADVKSIVQRKKETKKRPVVDFVAERLRLERKRDFHQEKHDLAEVDKLNQQIEELAKVKRLKRTARGRRDGMADVNRRNIKANFETSLYNKTAKEETSNALEDGLDPFQRRATRPPKYWRTGPIGSKTVKPAVQPEKRKEPPVAAPKVTKRIRTPEEFVKGIRKLDLDLNLKVVSPTPTELLVFDILPTSPTFGDEQQKLEAAVKNGTKRSLTLKDYKSLIPNMPVSKGAA